MVKIYLAGHINDNSHLWRTQAKKYLKKHLKHVKIYDPEEFEVKRQNIVQLDLEYINKSDLLLVNITKHSPGTSMEMVYAHLFKKPMYVSCPNRLLSPWIEYHIASGSLNSNLDDALANLVGSCT